MVGNLLRLHQEVHVVRAQVFHFRKFKGLDQVQHLQHRDPLGGRRRLVQSDAAIVGRDRVAPLRALRAKVRFGEESAVCARIARELLRDLAFVIGVAPAGADGFNRTREIRIHQALSRARRVAVFQKDRGGFPVLRQFRRGCGDPVGEAFGHRETFARIAGGRSQIARQRQASMRRMGFAPARHRTRHGERRRQDAAERDFVHAALAESFDRSACRRAAGAVEVADALLLGIVDQPERVSAQARHMRIDDAQGGACGDGRIHRGASRFQDFDAGFGCEGMWTRNHAPRCERRRAACLHSDHGLFFLAR